MIINEIIKNEDEMIFFDSQWLSKYRINDIAESLVARRYREDSSRSNFYYNNTKLVMHFPGSAISNIIQTGQFLNSYQVDYKSKGWAKKERAIVEAEFLNFTPDHFVGEVFQFNDSDKRIHYLRPKYAFCILDTPETGFYSFFHKTRLQISKKQYGSFSACFSDALKSRSTFTTSDSSCSKETFNFFTGKINLVPYECQIFGEIGMEHVLYFQTSLEAELFENNKIEELKKLEKKIISSQGDVLFDPNNGHTLITQT